MWGGGAGSFSAILGVPFVSRVAFPDGIDWCQSVRQAGPAVLRQDWPNDIADHRHRALQFGLRIQGFRSWWVLMIGHLGPLVSSDDWGDDCHDL